MHSNVWETKNQIIIILVDTSDWVENKCWELIRVGEICLDFGSKSLFLSRRAGILEANFKVFILEDTELSQLTNYG